MKKPLIIGIAALLAVTVIALVLFLIFGSDTDRNALLRCSHREQVEAFYQESKVEVGQIDDSGCYMEGVSLFGRDAVVEVTFNGDQIGRLHVSWTLHQVDYSEDGSADFTAKDKKTASAELDAICKEFGEFLGTELEQYDLIPLTGEAPQDSDDAFFRGEHMREYSVRDREGTLWLLDVDAASGMVTADLTKLVDESGFDGFIPVLDLTKQ